MAAMTLPVTLSIESAGAFSRIEIGTGDLPIELVRTENDAPATASYILSTPSVSAGVVEMLRAAADAIEGELPGV